MTTSDLPKLAAPAQRALSSVSVKRLSDLTKFTEKEIAELHGMGPNALGKLRETLRANHIGFKK